MYVLIFCRNGAPGPPGLLIDWLSEMVELAIGGDQRPKFGDFVKLVFCGYVGLTQMELTVR